MVGLEGLEPSTNRKCETVVCPRFCSGDIMKKYSTMVIYSTLQQELADCLRSLNLDTFMFSF